MIALDRIFPARPERLCDIRHAVAAAAAALGCAENEISDVVLAVDEACQNIIRHAYHGAEGDIVVRLSAEGDQLEVELIDFAPRVDIALIHPRPLDEVRPGGLGTHFIGAVMDSVDFPPPPEGIGNLLRMVKRIGGEP